MKKYIILSLMVLIISVLSVGIYFYTEKTEKAISGKQNYEIETGHFIKEYSDNKEVADKKYLNKTILVKGKIKSYTGISNGINVELSAGNEMETVTCSIDSSQIKKETTLNVGQEVSIKGRCGGYLTEDMIGLKNIGLVQCSIIN